MEVAGHVFLVSGGASGLGAACARRLAGDGGSVVIADIHETAGDALAVELGDCALFTRCDVTDERSVLGAIGAACSRFGRLDGAIHCAGILGASRILAREGPHDLALFRRVIDVNLVGSFNVLRLAAAAMADNPPGPDDERGVIVLTSSVAALEGQVGQAAYAASKAGVAGLTLPAARELGRFGIRVVSLAPGTFDTPMMAAVPEAIRQSLADQMAFPKRLGRPEELAALAVHVIQNVMLNGSVLRLDGGVRMGPK